MSNNRSSATYKQCALEQGTKQHTAWIPTQFAVAGKVIDIDDYGKGWVVKAVGSIERSAKDADAASTAYKRTRKASDI